MEYDDTLSIVENKKGFWIHDKTRGINISMKEKDKDLAFFKALKYYQKRLLTVESELKEANTKLDDILSIIDVKECEYNE